MSGMPDSFFGGLFDGGSQTLLRVPQFLLCVGVSLLIGLFLAAVYRYRCTCTRSFVQTLAVLPAAVCVVIMMVNGNIGAGVATAGAFSLVRFRSAPGSAREIGAIFIAMAAGLIVGMGYLGYAAVFALIIGFVWLLYRRLGFGRRGAGDRSRVLRITIPEDLNYTEVFDELLGQYTASAELISVKTTNMGSLYKLIYHITLRDAAQEKAMIDALRCRNGNLEIAVSRQEVDDREL